MQIWKFQDHVECPRCPEQHEDPPHILNCPAPSATLHWEKALTALEVWMTAHHTMPELTTAILRYLHKWKHPNPSRRLPEPQSLCNMAFGLLSSSRTTLAGNFLMGRLSIRWRDVQHRYYEWLQRHNTGKAWLQALIKKVWEVSWDMWDHRNEVRTTTITPATMWETENLNKQIIEQFEEGVVGLGQKDHHFLDKPLGHVLGYDLMQTLVGAWMLFL
jgi:hypothetical protein